MPLGGVRDEKTKQARRPRAERLHVLRLASRRWRPTMFGADMTPATTSGRLLPSQRVSWAWGSIGVGGWMGGAAPHQTDETLHLSCILGQPS